MASFTKYKAGFPLTQKELVSHFLSSSEEYPRSLKAQFNMPLTDEYILG